MPAFCINDVDLKLRKLTKVQIIILSVSDASKLTDKALQFRSKGNFSIIERRLEFIKFFFNWI